MSPLDPANPADRLAYMLKLRKWPFCLPGNPSSTNYPLVRRT